MIPRVVLATSSTPDGTPLVLSRESGHFMIRVGAIPLMSSGVHGSEEAMVKHGFVGIDRTTTPRVLIGGLGMGFTLRAALDALPPRADVHVVELLPELVEWNRGPLAELSKSALDDRRVAVEIADVREVIGRRPRAYDAVLLDVDNGPEALTVPSNGGLYSPKGLTTLRAALRPGGTAVIWSAFEARAFEERFRKAGFEVTAEQVRARGESRKGSRHVLYVGRLPTEAPQDSRRRR